MPTKAVVLARGGQGVLDPGSIAGRFALDLGIPRALLPLANRPLIAHALDWLDDAGIRQVALVAEDGLARELQPVVADDSRWSFELGVLGQAPGEALAKTFEDLIAFLDGDPFVLHLADSIAGPPLRALIGDDPPYGHESVMVVTRADRTGHAKVVELEARRGRRRRGACAAALQGRRSAGVFVLGGALLPVAATDAPPGKELESLAERVIELGGRVEMCEVNDWWRLGQGAEALLEGNRFALRGVDTRYDRASLRDTRVEGAVSIDPSARVEASIIRGPAIVGPGAILRDAYVGPYSSIGRDVTIEGAEVENSMILAGASIRHVGGRLEASVVGPGACICRDFRLPKALRVNVGEGAHVSLA
jgi:glucose-1-phosphate thymidylyltransferase